MTRRTAWHGVLAALALTAATVPAARAGARENDAPKRVRGPVTEAITDKDVEPFGLQVYWKAICVLGEHAKPKGVFPANNVVFVTDTYTRLSCYSAKNGRRRWITALAEPHQPLFAPAVTKRDVFMVAAGYVIVLDRQYGRERWRVRLKNIPAAGPAVSGNYIYVSGADGWLRAFNRTLKREAWFFNARAPLNIRPVPVGPKGQPNIFLAAADRKLYCMSTDERKIIWQEEANAPVVAEPAVVGRHLYIPCSDYNLYAVDVSQPTPRERLQWTFRSGSEVLESPVAIGATIYFPSFKNGFYAVRRADGKKRWWRETGVRLIAVSRDRCYILDQTRAILICDKDTGELKGRFVPPEGYTFIPTNRESDAIYLLSRDGLIICLREKAAIEADKAGEPSDSTGSDGSSEED